MKTINIPFRKRVSERKIMMMKLILCVAALVAIASAQTCNTACANNGDCNNTACTFCQGGGVTPGVCVDGGKCGTTCGVTTDCSSSCPVCAPRPGASQLTCQLACGRLFRLQRCGQRWVRQLRERSVLAGQVLRRHLRRRRRVRHVCVPVLHDVRQRQVQRRLRDGVHGRRRVQRQLHVSPVFV